MKNVILLLIVFVLINGIGVAQMPGFVFDSTLNNLVLPHEYKTSEYGAIPDYSKHGKGDHTLILIPGWGFDKSVFDDFIASNKNNYTMYSITIPGYGKTQAPPMPDSGVSYGEQYWNKGVMKGIVKLIEEEHIKDPVLVGSFVQGDQIALQMAIDYKEIIGGVIILGGPAKFIPVGRGDPKQYTLEKRIAGIDSYMGPKWFKSITKQSFDNGNYLPELYSLDTVKAKKLWEQNASVSLPVMVQYLCEFFASDITLQTQAITCPVLILRGTFGDSVLQKPGNNYVKPQFIDTWDEVTSSNPKVLIKDIQGAASFVWKDKPVEVYKAVREFIDRIKSR